MFKSFLAIGDSITEGYGDPVGGLACRSWADWVFDALRTVAPDLAYRNVGSKGATASTILREQVPEIEAVRPDLVSVTVGANDARKPGWTAKVFESQYASILDAISDAGAQVMTAAYPDITPALERAGQPVPESWRPYFERMHDVDEVIRQVGARYDAWLVDLEFDAMAKEPRYLSRDFAHPNALGYRESARVALGVLADRLAMPELAEIIPVSDAALGRLR